LHDDLLRLRLGILLVGLCLLLGRLVGIFLLLVMRNGPRRPDNHGRRSRGANHPARHGASSHHDVILLLEGAASAIVHFAA
jgi:hypothetical protein